MRAPEIPSKKPRIKRDPSDKEYEQRLIAVHARALALMNEFKQSLSFYRDWDKTRKVIRDSRPGTIAATNAIKDSIEFILNESELKKNE